MDVTAPTPTYLTAGYCSHHPAFLIALPHDAEMNYEHQPQYGLLPMRHKESNHIKWVVDIYWCRQDLGCTFIGFLQNPIGTRVPTLLKIGTRSAFERNKYIPTYKVSKTCSAFERNLSD